MGDSASRSWQVLTTAGSRGPTVGIRSVMEVQGIAMSSDIRSYSEQLLGLPADTASSSVLLVRMGLSLSEGTCEASAAAIRALLDACRHVGIGHIGLSFNLVDDSLPVDCAELAFEVVGRVLRDVRMDAEASAAIALSGLGCGPMSFRELRDLVDQVNSSAVGVFVDTRPSGGVGVRGGLGAIRVLGHRLFMVGCAALDVCELESSLRDIGFRGVQFVDG